MARKGALHRIGRGRYVVIPADVLYGRQTFVADPFQIVDQFQIEGPGFGEENVHLYTPDDVTSANA